MSITALTWAILYCGAIAAALMVNPLFGALGYLLEYYMRPELKWWGDELPSLRYNLIISMTLGVTFLLRRSTLREMVDVPVAPIRWLVSLGVVMVLVTLTVAVNREVSWGWTVQWWKMALIFPLLIYGVVRTRNAFNLFIATHVLGALWWGWQAYTDPKRQHGRLMNIGSGDSLDDNGAAAHLLTVLPFIAILILTEKDKRLRWIAVAAAPLVINTLILCNSRGSMLGLLVAMAAALFLIKTGYRARMVWAGVAVVTAFFLLADQQFISRQQTTASYEKDGSANERLITWQAAFQLVKDRPLGSGGRGFHFLSPVYIPEIVAAHGGEMRAPHNSYAMVASEWGVLGLICYLGFYFSVLSMMQEVKKRAGPAEGGFFYWRAMAIQLAIIAFLVAGTFSDRVYAEAGYWMFGLACALRRIQATDQAEAAAPVEAAAPAAAHPAIGWPVPAARHQ